MKKQSMLSAWLEPLIPLPEIIIKVTQIKLSVAKKRLTNLNRQIARLEKEEEFFEIFSSLQKANTRHAWNSCYVQYYFLTNSGKPIKLKPEQIPFSRINVKICGECKKNLVVAIVRIEGFHDDGDLEEDPEFYTNESTMRLCFGCHRILDD